MFPLQGRQSDQRSRRKFQPVDWRKRPYRVRDFPPPPIRPRQFRLQLRGDHGLATISSRCSRLLQSEAALVRSPSWANRLRQRLGQHSGKCLGNHPISRLTACNFQWGGILSTNLRAVTMAVAMTKICQSYYPDVTISPRIMCAGTTGGNTCVGDGGAPLVNQNTGELYGMGLFSKYCSTGGAPSGFVNVANQRYWIYSVTGV